jgi:hypothetical protein
MVVPVFLGITMVAAHHSHQAASSLEMRTALLATLLHAASYLLVTALVAVLVFEKLGLAILRKAWVNLDWIWAAALIATGTLTVVL